MSPKLKFILGLAVLASLAVVLFGADSLKAAFRLLYPLRPADPAATGLVGYWTFDGGDISGTTATDRGSGKNSGTLTNGPTQTAGQVSGALQFDGSDDYVDAGVTFPSGDFSVTMWANLDVLTISAAGHHRRFFHWYNGTSQLQAFKWASTDPTRPNRISFDVAVGTTGAETTSTFTDTNTWAHLAFVRIGSAYLIYRDGVQQPTGTPAADNNPNPTTQTLRIGADIAETGSNGHFDGSLDDVRVYNRALSANEIKIYYDATAVAGRALTGSPSRPNTSPRDSLTSGLVGYWTFDGQDANWSTGVVNDRSGQGNNGNVRGDMATSSAPIPGIHGQALQFDGVNDFVEIADSSNWNFTISSSWSIALWINSKGWITGSLIYGRSADDSLLGGENYFYYSSSGLAWGPVNSEWGTLITLENNRWYHLTMVYDASTSSAYAYVDGVRRANLAVTAVGSSSGPLKIADNYNINFFNGSLDDVRVYNRALSAAEVRQLYDIGAKNKITANVSPTTQLTSGLVGYWTFDGNDTPWTSATAATTIDRSGSANTGTLTNMSQSTAPVPGIHGQALQFDGGNDYVSIGDITISPTTARSWGAWFNLQGNNAAGLHGIVSHAGAGNTGYEILYRQSDDNIFCGLGGSDTSGTVVTPARNTWNHVFCAWDGTTLRMYLNGAQRQSASLSSIGDPTNALVIGTGANDTTRAFNGPLDDVRVYNRALSGSEVQVLYQLGRR